VPQTRLTNRDQDLLRDTWLHRYLTAKQILRLHFTHLKVAQRRLRKLHKACYLDRFRPATATKKGFRTWWYRLGRLGAKLVAEHQGQSAGDVMPPSRTPTSMGFLAHHGLVTDFRIWLREACQDQEGFGYEFVPSYEEVRRKGRRRRRIALQVPDERRLLIPDGAFTLQHQPTEKAVLFMLEADRGTEPLTGRHRSAIEKKLAMYAAVYDSHGEDAYQTLFSHDFEGFRVLCIVPNPSRRDAFLRLSKDADLAPLVWTATQEFLEEPGNLDAQIWRAAPRGEGRALSE